MGSCPDIDIDPEEVSLMIILMHFHLVWLWRKKANVLLKYKLLKQLVMIRMPIFFFLFLFFFTIGPAPLLKMIKQHEMSFPDCTLCMNQHQNPVYRILCGHNFCNYCISCVIEKIGFCPQCSREKRFPGNQPPGYMTWRTESLKSLPGYEGCKTIVITFNFRGEIQGSVDLETFWG